MTLQYLNRDKKPRLAYVHSPASGKGRELPPVMFMGGYRSDMNGTKATFLESQCRKRGQEFLRFDYSGHGASEGKFDDGTIGSWAHDAQDMLDHAFSERKIIIVGSSMGGWIGLLTSQSREESVHGFIGIAAAPDYTEAMYEALTPDQKKKLDKGARVAIPNDYSAEPYTFSKEFYTDGKEHLLLNRPHRAGFPIRLIQGMQDKDVPWETAVKIQKAYRGGEVDIVFVEDGDHRLSRIEDLALIDREVVNLSASVA